MGAGAYYLLEGRGRRGEALSGGGATDRFWTKGNTSGAGAGMYLIGLGALLKTLF